MTDALIQAATALADALIAENQLLAAVDLSRAAALIETKQQAVARFMALQGTAPPAYGTALYRQAAEAIERLGTLADENRRLLERAIATQGRVIKLVVSAAPAPIAQATHYGAAGALLRSPRTAPMALSARA